MFGINLLNYMDRWVAASAGPTIQKDLGITDAMFGLLGTAFLLVYAIAALPFGTWADRGVRKTVIGVGVTIWSIATLLTGFARTFGQIFLSRAVVGIGEARLPRRHLPPLRLVPQGAAQPRHVDL